MTAPEPVLGFTVHLVVCVALAAGLLGAAALLRYRVRRPPAARGDVYECGEPPQGDSWRGLPVGFFLVALLFILFDVEAVFMIPWAVIYRRLPKITGSPLFGFWEMLVYLGFVVVGLYYIVRKGILNWSQDKADL